MLLDLESFDDICGCIGGSCTGRVVVLGAADGDDACCDDDGVVAGCVEHDAYEQRLQPTCCVR